MIKAILFDFGGVLAELRGEAHILGLIGDRMTRAEMWHHWSHSPAVRAHETGAIDAVEFSQRIVKELALPTTPAQFQVDFANWIVGPFAETASLIRTCAARYQTALLTNISAHHWPVVESLDILPHMHHVHASFKVGSLKPDPIYFESALARVGCAADEAIFFDDSPVNVAGATALGITAVRVNGAAEVQHALLARGLL